MKSHQQLILVPGLLNDAALWQDQIETLSDTYDVAVADISHGTSLPELAEAVLSIANNQFALAGFSLGGIVALQIMRQVPERVLHLALLNTTMLPDDDAQIAQRAFLAKQARGQNRFHGFGTKIAATHLSPSNTGRTDYVEKVRGMAKRLGREVFLRQILMERPDNRDVLARITCPTLVICGEHDTVTPPDVHHQMAVTIEHSVLKILPNAGHLTPIEQPQMVNEALQHLLSRS